MTHSQVFGKKFTPIRRFSAWKTHTFWPHISNMTQYGSAPPEIPTHINPDVAPLKPRTSPAMFQAFIVGEPPTNIRGFDCQLGVRNSAGEGRSFYHENILSGGAKTINRGLKSQDSGRDQTNLVTTAEYCIRFRFSAENKYE